MLWQDTSAGVIKQRNAGNTAWDTLVIAPPNGSITQAKLATGVAGTAPAFSAYQSSAQTVTLNVQTKVLFQTEEFDTNSNYDTSNSRFTPTVAGYYQVNAGVNVATTATTIALTVYKNGAAFKRMQSTASATGQCNGTSLVYMNGSTDYIEIYTNLGATQALAADASLTYFQASMVRAA